MPLGRREGGRASTWQASAECGIEKRKSPTTNTKPVNFQDKDIPNAERMRGERENRRETHDMRVNSRVEMIKNSHKLAIRGLKNPVLTRISRLVTRLNPLKPSQVPDFPDIESKQSAGGVSNFMNSRISPTARAGRWVTQPLTLRRPLVRSTLIFAGHFARKSDENTQNSLIYGKSIENTFIHSATRRLTATAP